MVYSLYLNNREAQQMGLALLVALLLHLVLLFAVDFHYTPERRSPEPAMLEVILVPIVPPPDGVPETPSADYLAQATQQGSGSREALQRPATVMALAETPQSGDSPHQQARQIPRPEPPPPPKTVPLQAQVKSTVTTPPPPLPEPEQPRVVAPSAAELLRRSSSYVQQLASEIREQQDIYSSKPRETYITASTQAYLYASYEESWRLKIERIGNLNYPVEARRQGLNGSLILDVAIAADGSLHSVKVMHSSGSKILDEGARLIVELAAPFAPLPPAIREQTDILHITRAWQFGDQYFLTTR
ncbi:MAG: TonB family protein [Gammaproteobacteria bacterium]|nr:TonB family protein [Gammaproteobacteria bacterium]